MVTTVLICVFWIVLWLFLLYRRLHHIPGPTISKFCAFPLWLSELSYRRNEKIMDWHQRYGPVVCISPSKVSVSELHGAKKMYGASQRWAKSNYFDHFKGYGVRSIFATKPYEDHQAKRKLMSSFYQASNIFKDPTIEQHAQERAQAVLNQISHGQEVDVYSLTDWYALDNITRLILGPAHCTSAVDCAGLERDILRDLKHLQFWMPLRVLSPGIYHAVSGILQSLCLPFGYFSADEKLASWCWEKTSRALADMNLDESWTVLRHLVRAYGAPPMTDLSKHPYIAAEVLDNINAAEATVAVTATYLIWRLTENPQWQRRIREELMALPIQNHGSLSFADVHSRVPSLEACLREVLRLHPASSGRAERIVPKGGYTFSGVHVPEGMVVTTCVSALHRDENVFPEPERFLPERWLDADETSFRRLDSHLIAFGTGGRICLGKSMALLEIKVLLAALYSVYETVMTPRFNASSMRQCSTHDAVPQALECVIRFQRPAA